MNRLREKLQVTGEFLSYYLDGNSKRHFNVFTNHRHADLFELSICSRNLFINPDPKNVTSSIQEVSGRKLQAVQRSSFAYRRLIYYFSVDYVNKRNVPQTKGKSAGKFPDGPLANLLVIG